MKVVILAGGMGTRLSEETDIRPKPMVEIGGKPILWHIMKTYSHYGYHDFVICLGYKGYYIKEYFHHYFLHLSDVTIDMRNNQFDYHNSGAEPWKITLVDTGLQSMTGGRIKRVQKYIGDEPFMLTYGDGVSDVNIKDLVQFHKDNNKLATMTAVQPTGKFGALDINEQDEILSFKEKPRGDGAWVNGGFFVLEPKVLNYLENDGTIWEKEPLEKLAKERQLNAYRHDGFWKPMDTIRDKTELEMLWNSGQAPWRIWKE